MHFVDILSDREQPRPRGVANDSDSSEKRVTRNRKSKADKSARKKNIAKIQQNLGQESTSKKQKQKKKEKST